MLGRMIKEWITSLLWGKAAIGWRITQSIIILGSFWLAYQGAMFYIKGTGHLRDDLVAVNKSLAQCIQNRVKDKEYQEKLEATIRDNNGKEKEIVFRDRPPPPPDKSLVEKAKEVLQNTATTISDNVDAIESKVFTDRRVGFGYLGSFTGAGIAHGAYVRYDILSVWGKSLNVGVGATYGRYRERGFFGMPPQTRSDFNFVVMGGFEL